jgi:hypothetical protein
MLTARETSTKTAFGRLRDAVTSRARKRVFGVTAVGGHRMGSLLGAR